MLAWNNFPVKIKNLIIYTKKHIAMILGEKLMKNLFATLYFN